MPLTPSIGLSVLVHLIVLLISGARRIFRSKRSKRRLIKRGRRTRSPALVSRFLGMMIPLTISVVIFSGAFKLIELSLKNRFSSIHLARQYISIIQAQEAGTAGEASGAPAIAYQPDGRTGPALPNNASIVLEENLKFDCQPLFNHFASAYDWSLVDYLVARGEPHDIASRESLALELGVEDYDASNEKNIEMLKALFIKNNETGVTDPAACLL